jgi:hypothetical protein
MAQWKGLDQIDDLIEKVESLPARVAEEMQTRVMDRTPVRSGYLKSRWQIQYTTTGFILGNDATYAPYVEFGTPKMHPVGMLGTTVMELPQITVQVLWSK